MCGVGGIFRPGIQPLTKGHEAALERMRRFLAPRGPDGSGVMVRGQAGLVHTRQDGTRQPLGPEDGGML